MPFRRAERRPTRVGLALAAGGAKGVAYVPFLAALEQMDVEITAVATDYWRRESVVFRSGSLVDGGITSTLPHELIRDQCDLLVALDVSNRSSDPDRTDVPRTPVMVLNTFRILTDSLTENKCRYDPPDVYYRLELPSMEMLDFHKYREVRDLVAPEVEQFRDELSRVLGR